MKQLQELLKERRLLCKNPNIIDYVSDQEQKSPHPFRVINLIPAIFSVTDEVRIQFGMRFTEGLCFFPSHHHEGGGISVGSGAVLGYDCGREDAVLYRCTDAWVDGMSISLAVLVVELAVVARGGHPYIAHFQDGL